MHLSTLSRCVGLICALAFATGGLRADDYPLSVTDVRFGFPPGQFAKDKSEYLFKAAKWAPITITLKCREPIPDQEIEIVVGTPDGDDVISEVRYRMGAPRAGDNQTVQLQRQLFLKPGAVSSSVSVQIRSVTSGKPLAESFQQRLTGLAPSRYLILSAGSSLPGMRLTRLEGQTSDASIEDNSLRNGWVQLAHAVELPDHWFGYDAVDVLILNADFDKMIGNDSTKANAIAEWVERGGRLLVCGGAGRNMHLIHGPGGQFPLEINPQAERSVDEIPMILPNSSRLLLRGADGGAIPLYGVKSIPDRPHQTRLLADEREQPYPLVVQTSYGLGRVTFVAFDLDRPPFDAWPARAAFWEWLLESAGSRLPSGSEHGVDGLAGDQEDRYLTRLQNNLEFFEGVPIVSFGWVALLILLYILVIGPIEYLVLKRLLKRLELTWLTFPIIVGATCLLAYLAAFDLKGHQLRINKIDLVDIDLREQRVSGQTWFTLFSPRIQNYTIGVEPIVAQTKPADILVSWHGAARGSRQSLFRRAYTYHISADAYANGLEQVPIQIWSTKSFTARWATATDGPLIESTLRIAEADPNEITGSITNRLPLAVLVDAQLIYRDRVVPAPPLLQGAPRYLSTGKRDVSATSWLHNAITHKDLVPASQSARAGRGEFADDPNFNLWPMLFHDLVQGQFGRHWNASVRQLDQSWRIGDKNPAEAVLIARLEPVSGPAEEISNSPSSPTRLWLGAIPGGTSSRQPIDGILRQETYIRVYIPISPLQK